MFRLCMVCVCLCMWFMACIWRSEDNLVELLFSVHPVDLGDQTQFPELAASPLLLASQP